MVDDEIIASRRYAERFGFVVERTLSFRGSPLRFRQFVEWYADGGPYVERGRWFGYAYNERIDYGHANFQAWKADGQLSGAGYVEAIATGDGAQIRVYAALDWPELSKVWKLFEDELVTLGLTGGSAEHRQGLTAAAEPTVTLGYIEQKIKDAYDRIVSEGELCPTDDAIAARLPIGRKGQPITRETVNRYRRKMRRCDIKV